MRKNMKKNFFALLVFAAFNFNPLFSNPASQINEYILENRRVLSEFLDKNDINLKIVSGYATYLLWIDISYYSHDSEEFTRRLKEEAKIVVGSGKHYHEHFSSFIRVNIATQRENILHLCNSLKDFLGGNKDEKTN